MRFDWFNGFVCIVQKRGQRSQGSTTTFIRPGLAVTVGLGSKAYSFGGKV